MWIQGTEHLLAAARAVGVERLVARSYADCKNVRKGGPAKTEAYPLDAMPAKAQMRRWRRHFLEQAVLDAPLERIVLA
ncbi:MAG: NAD(P)-dependent oxidoreductase, partial [Gaiellaceae bacterium]